MFFDTHAHLDDEQFDEIRPDVFERMRTAKIDRVIVVGTTVEASKKCIEIADQYSEAFAAVGIQPNYCHEASDESWNQILELVKQPQVAAIGETGLDRYWDHCPFEIQQEYFRRHIQLSVETGLPFIVHMRDCGQDILDSFSEFSGECLNGVMHSFTGDWELAEKCLNLGLYISFAGMVTFKKSDDLRAVAAKIPLDRILIETDAPYLSPHPKRSQRPNEPALVTLTAKCLADQHNIGIEEMAMHTTNNAKRLFKKAV